MVLNRPMNSRLGNRLSNQADGDSPRTAVSVFRVNVPDNVLPGAKFQVYAGSRVVRVRAPVDSFPGQSLQISIPQDVRAPPARPSPQPPPVIENRHEQRRDERPTNVFQVIVPRGVQPGDPFPLMARGVRVLVTCPLNATPGQKIRFKLPRALSKEAEAPLADGCWIRKPRESDMRFQWIRLDKEGKITDQAQFDTEKSAFARKLEFQKGPDSKFRQGVLTLEPASEVTVDSKVKDSDGRLLIQYSDIEKVQSKPFEEKAEWFHQICDKLTVQWERGHMRMNVRRDFLLGDSFDAVMSLGRGDLRKRWRFVFIGEEAIDAGGPTREWFHLVTKHMFDPDMGLWQSSDANQMKMRINPSSALCCEDHLQNFRFLGRVMGKALFDKQLCVGRMVPYMYKHLLAWPVSFADLETDDEEYYNNLKQLKSLMESGHDLSMLCLDFTTGQEIFGMQEEVELVKGGTNMALTNETFPEYLEACLKYKLFNSVKNQISELMLGVFDVIPGPLLAVFDSQELELLMSGRPTIDMKDWHQNTEYSGEYDSPWCRACRWFWEVVESFDEENKAKLLHFATGTSGVPSRGFAALQSNDGNIRKFTIHGIPLQVCLYPRAHTCFNRLDLPVYRSKEDLEENLKLAMTTCTMGFHIE